MADSLIPINIIVADRSYRLKIEAADEEMVRKTIKLINEKIVDYKTNFAGKDMQDYVAMVLLWFATEQQKPTIESKIADNEIDKLQRIDKALNQILNNNK